MRERFKDTAAPAEPKATKVIVGQTLKNKKSDL